VRTTAVPADVPAGVLDSLPDRLRLGTRRSPLARTQSRWVADRLTEALARALPDRSIEVELVEITTRGDVTKASLATLGGTGVFVSALREALLAKEIDLAVHSLKDLPTAAADDLVLAAVPVREDPSDVLVARDGLSITDLPPGSRVGTGSPRRAAQVRALGLGLDVVDVRGNVDTRLRMVGDGTLDAVVLAHAGLARLGRAAEATMSFGPELMLPAPGQGALAAETRAADAAVSAALALLDHPVTRACVSAERALLARLEAGCAAPLGALAQVRDGGARGLELALEAVVISTDGTRSLRRSAAVPYAAGRPSAPVDVDGALQLGRSLAEQMLDDGAAELIPGPISTPSPLLAAGTAGTAGEGDS
jgi:hydroxymethylbilane synthase